MESNWRVRRLDGEGLFLLKLGGAEHAVPASEAPALCRAIMEAASAGEPAAEDQEEGRPARSRERTGAQGMSRHSLTLPVGTTMQSRAHVTTDSDRDRYLATAYAHDTAGAITRPTGEPVPLSRSTAGQNDGGWSARQQSAARHLQGYWRDALPLRGLPAGYSGGKKPSGEISEEEAAVAQMAWNAYVEAMALVQRRCSDRHERCLRLVVVYDEPSPLWAAALVREALTFLADEWGLDRQGRKAR